MFVMRLAYRLTHSTLFRLFFFFFDFAMYRQIFFNDIMVREAHIFSVLTPHLSNFTRINRIVAVQFCRLRCVCYSLLQDSTTCFLHYTGERERERVSSTVIAISFLLGRVCIVQTISNIIYQFDISIRAVRRQSSIIIINVNIPNPQI